MVPKKMGTATWCQDYRSSGNLQSSTACCGLVSLCSVIFRNFLGLSTWCCFLCNSPLRKYFRHVVHKDPYHCDSFLVWKLLSLSEGSLHHDPSIYIQLLDVHLLAWDPGSWYGDYGCFQKWGIQTEWWWIENNHSLPAMHSEWDTCTSISYNLVSHKIHVPSQQFDVKLSWMVIIGTLDLKKNTPSIPYGGIFKGSLPGEGVESRVDCSAKKEVANTTIGSPAALWSFNLCWCSAFRIFVMKLFSLVIGVLRKFSTKTWNTHHSSMGPLYKNGMRTPKNSMILFFWGGVGVLWEEILGYHFCRKKNAALICTQKDKPEICKVEDD